MEWCCAIKDPKLFFFPRYSAVTASSYSRGVSGAVCAVLHPYKQQQQWGAGMGSHHSIPWELPMRMDQGDHPPGSSVVTCTSLHSSRDHGQSHSALLQNRAIFNAKDHFKMVSKLFRKQQK